MPVLFDVVAERRVRLIVLASCAEGNPVASTRFTGTKARSIAAITMPIAPRMYVVSLIKFYGDPIAIQRIEAFVCAAPRMTLVVVTVIRCGRSFVPAARVITGALPKAVVKVFVTVKLLLFVAVPDCMRDSLPICEAVIVQAASSSLIVEVESKRRLELRR